MASIFTRAPSLRLVKEGLGPVITTKYKMLIVPAIFKDAKTPLANVQYHIYGYPKNPFGGLQLALNSELVMKFIGAQAESQSFSVDLNNFISPYNFTIKTFVNGALKESTLQTLGQQLSNGVKPAEPVDETPPEDDVTEVEAEESAKEVEEISEEEALAASVEAHAASNSSGGFMITTASCGTAPKIIIDKQPLEETPAEPIYPDLVTPQTLPAEMVEVIEEAASKNPGTFGVPEVFTFERLVERGVDLAKLFFSIEDYKEREKVYDPRGDRYESKIPNAGKPVNNNDPFPIDEKIEEMESHLPFIKIHRLTFCDPHPHTVQLAKIIMDLSDKTEKRLVQLENNVATVIRNLHRVGSRININCVYYGGQSVYEKYKTIRCMHHDRIADGQLMTLEQCMNCTRYEPIIGKVYEILDETGQSLDIINDDNQMAYRMMNETIEQARMEEKPSEIKKVTIDLTKIKDRNEDEVDFKDIWGKGFAMDWNLVPAEKQIPHVMYDDGASSNKLDSSYSHIEHHNDPTGAGFEGIGIFYGPETSPQFNTIGYGGGYVGPQDSSGGFTGTGYYSDLEAFESTKKQIEINESIFAETSNADIKKWHQDGVNYAKNNTDTALKNMKEQGYESVLREICKEMNFDPLLALALIVVESTGQISPSYDNRAGDGYWGLMQVDKNRLLKKSSNYSSLSPLEKAKVNIREGITMFNEKLKTCWKTTNIMVGTIGFNSGEGMIKGVSGSGVPPVYDPGTTKDKVNEWTYDQIYKNLERNVTKYYGQKAVKEKLTYYPRVHEVYKVLLTKEGFAPTASGASGSSNASIPFKMLFPYNANDIKKGVKYTSLYGVMRDIDGDGVYTMHHGCDFVGPAGCDIIASAPGTVYFAGAHETAGYMVGIQHANNVRTLYMHMKKGSLTVSNGNQVEAGMKIGVQGSTGRSTGAHLHYEIRVGGTSSQHSYDPTKVFPQISGMKGKIIKFNL